MDTKTLSNVLMGIIKSLGNVYGTIYNQLQQANIPLPPPDQVMNALANTLQSVYDMAPLIVRQWYNVITELPLQSSILPIVLLFLVLYIVFSLVMATVRGLIRMVYGFIRFSLMVALIGATLMCIQQYYVAQGSSFWESVVQPILQSLLQTEQTASSGHQPYRATYQTQYRVPR